MPLTIDTGRTPGGHQYLCAVASGDVTPDDAQGLMNVFSPGKEHFGLALLGVVTPGANFSAEARKIFTATSPETDANPAPVALVVPNAPLRVTLSFMLRITGAAKRTRFFANELEAAAWLSERLDT